jgi:hypothetical protein
MVTSNPVKQRTGSPDKVERHPQTLAAKTTTPLTATPRPGPTPAQIKADQAAQAERSTAAKVPAVSPPSAPPVNSEEAIERHLAQWSGPGGRLYAFNGSTGIHRLLDDGTDMPAGQLFRAYLRDYRRGFIRFNGDDPPSLKMVGLSENADLPTRESLGDNDPTQWPISEQTNQPEDPWKPQATFPIVTTDDAAELYLYVARGIVALNAVDSLLGRWRHHPKRKQGFLPVIAIYNGTYYSRKFNCDRPKPEFRITGWVSEDDAPPPASADPVQRRNTL